MLAKKCDKCGKLYELYEGIEAYDLCPECLVKVQAFIEGKEVLKHE